MFSHMSFMGMVSIFLFSVSLFSLMFSMSVSFVDLLTSEIIYGMGF